MRTECFGDLGPLEKRRCEGSRNTGAEEGWGGVAEEQEQGREVGWGLGTFLLCQPSLLHLCRDTLAPLAQWG